VITLVHKQKEFPEMKLFNFQ